MQMLKLILKWISGVFLSLSGLVILFTEPLIGAVTLLLGIFLMPFTYNLLQKKTNLRLSSGSKWIVAVCGIVLLCIIISLGESSKQAEYDVIVTNASKKIDENKMSEAIKLIDEAKAKYKTKKNKATELEAEILKSKDERFAKEILVNMSDDEFNNLNANKLTKTYLSQKTLNANLIGLLMKYSPERAIIVKQNKAKEEEERALAEAEQKAKEIEEFNKNRKENIEKQFSAYDGSHRGLEHFIKNNMNDPDSYDHIETRFSDKGDYLFVVTKFRGANAFGGKVINIVSAKVDFDGNVLEILSQD